MAAKTNKDISRIRDANRLRVERSLFRRLWKANKALRTNLIRKFNVYNDPSFTVKQTLKPFGESLTKGAEDARQKGIDDGIVNVKRQIKRTPKIKPKRQTNFAISDMGVDPIFQLLHGMQLDLTEVITSTAEIAVSEGLNRKDQIRLLKDNLNAKGFADKAKNSFMVETWARTTTNLYYSAGLADVSNDPEVFQFLWGWEYLTVGDDRVREEHQGYDGVRLPKNHPFWNQNKPPNGWNCRCTIVEIYEEEPVKLPEPVVDDGVEIPPVTDEAFKFDPATLVTSA
jgi:SPP1 gp7 family putative phage head morphogenesis protein